MEDANFRGERNEIPMKGTKFEMEKEMRAWRWATEVLGLIQNDVILEHDIFFNMHNLVWILKPSWVAWFPQNRSDLTRSSLATCMNDLIVKLTRLCHPISVGLVQTKFYDTGLWLPTQVFLFFFLPKKISTFSPYSMVLLFREWFLACTQVFSNWDN